MLNWVQKVRAALARRETGRSAIRAGARDSRGTGAPRCVLFRAIGRPPVCHEQQVRWRRCLPDLLTRLRAQSSAPKASCPDEFAELLLRSRVASMGHPA
jgi:hypothetical protein